MAIKLCTCIRHKCSYYSHTHSHTRWVADGQTISGLALFVVRRFSYGCCICTGKHEALETLHVFQRLMQHVCLPLHRSWNQCDFVKILGLREGEDVVSIIPCCCCYTRELSHALIHLNAKNNPPPPSEQHLFSLALFLCYDYGMKMKSYLQKSCINIVSKESDRKQWYNRHSVIHTFRSKVLVYFHFRSRATEILG